MATDVDAIMEPPVPPPLSSPPLQPQSRSQLGNSENHKNLKRPIGELEKERDLETRLTKERNVRMREEKDRLPEDIEDLRKQAQTGLHSSADQEIISGSSTQAQRRESDNGAGARGLANGTPLRSGQTPTGHPIIDSSGDVEMENGTVDSLNAQRASTSSPQRSSGRRGGAAVENQPNARRTTRQSAAGAPSQKSTAPSTKSTDAGNVPPNSEPARAATSQSQASSSTLAYALGHASSASPASSLPNGEANSPPSSNPAHANISQHSPSMENILKVAEAAVAAQNAANQAKLAAIGQSRADTSDPNLDPSLFSDANRAETKAGEANNGNPTQTDAIKPSPPHVNTTTTESNGVASTSAPTPTSAATSSSSLSNNPYLSLSTNLLSRGSPGSATPTGHPMFMPYPLFYPPGNPGTPNSPSYPMPYNPYYYLTAPMPPNGMYPPPGNFTPPQPQQRPPHGEPQRAKPKRLKTHTVTTKSFSIPMVPRDKKGKPMLPLNVGIMTVINLGEVCMREHFHTERYIFPVGYEVTRRYLSTVDPSIEVVYHCTILDGGDGPKFQIIPSDRPDKPIIAGTATGAWSNIVKQANAIRNRQHSNSVSGPDFFGLGQNTIKHLIQELPNADRLRDYVWQNFVEGGPLGGRHAAVIPALPEEYDASLPIGAYYPKRDTNPNPNLPRGMSHYPQHIIAQAEAQKLQRLAAEQQQQQQQQQQPPIASSSGSSSTAAPTTQPNPQHDSAKTMPNPGAAADALNIQQYQSPRNQDQLQGQVQPAPNASEKRATKTSATGGTTSPSTAARQTRARGNQQQQPVNGAEVASVNADGAGPTTFASIMSAYPAPGIPAVGQPTSSTS